LNLNSILLLALGLPFSQLSFSSRGRFVTVELDLLQILVEDCRHRKFTPAGKPSAGVMRGLLLFVVFLLITLGRSTAFTTKKREPTRRAFKSASVNNNMKEEAAAASPTTAAAAGGNSAAFAFAHRAAVAHGMPHDDLDEEVVIGYATALISCALSLALGFGLGYGT
jgi:hypothetical protein